MIQLDEFRLLRVPLSNGGSPFYRDLLVKEDDRCVETASAGAATLFVIHLDYWVTEKQLKTCLEIFGKVADIQIRSVGPDKKSQKKYGIFFNNQLKMVPSVIMTHVTFAEPEAIRRVLDTCPFIMEALRWRSKDAGGSPNQKLQPNPMAVPSPLIKECTKALFPSRPEDLTKKVKSFMENFDKQTAEEKQQSKSNLNRTDEDGFTLVTSAGTKTADGVVVQSVKPSCSQLTYRGIFSKTTTNSVAPLTSYTISSSNKRKRSQSRGGIESDFYRFQLKEQKRQELADFRKQKQVDAREVLKMRMANKFKIV